MTLGWRKPSRWREPSRCRCRFRGKFERIPPCWYSRRAATALFLSPRGSLRGDENRAEMKLRGRRRASEFTRERVAAATDGGNEVSDSGQISAGRSGLGDTLLSPHPSFPLPIQPQKQASCLTVKCA